jgi:hypothetical protein
MADYLALCYGLGITVVVFFAAYAFVFSWWWVSALLSRMQLVLLPQPQGALQQQCHERPCHMFWACGSSFIAQNT